MTASVVAVPVPTHERFEITAKLGEGSMGVVYAARDKERDKPVALKVTRSATSKRIYRFKREFRALAELSHPNIIELYELIASGNQWLLAMELIDGDELLDHLGVAEHHREDSLEPGQQFAVSQTMRASEPSPSESGSNPGGTLFDDTGPRESRRGKLSLAWRAPDKRPSVAEIVDCSRLREVLAQLAAALCALHRGGIIHRDLKPSNVMVTSEGRVVLMDFGVVAELNLDREDSESSTAVMGTPAFMAPEQGLGRPPSAAADWYAFGVILYRALTGFMPFYGSPLALLVGKQERSPTPVTELVEEAPAELVELCARLLSLRPGDRPSGTEVLAALGAEESDSRGSLLEVDATGPFVGRVRELDALRLQYAQVQTGGVSLVILEGVAGIGKTSLARELTTELCKSATPPLVLRARCRARESLPYKALDEAIDALCVYLSELEPEAYQALLPEGLPCLARLFPVLERFVSSPSAKALLAALRPREMRERALTALRQLLEALGRARPVVVLIEDLQWVDDDSVPLLEALFEMPARGRLLVVASARSEASGASYSESVRALLSSLEQRSLCQRMELGPLSPAEQRNLLTALEPGFDGQPGVVELLTRDAGGHPLLLSELARAQRAEASGEGRVLGLDELICRRAAGLEHAERSMLELLVVAGEALPPRVLARASGLGEVVCARATRTLGLERFVRGSSITGELRVDIYQDKISEAVLAELAPARLVELADCLALALEDWGEAAPASLARLWRDARAYEKSAAYLLEAGRAAVRALAFAQAQTHYRGAFELGTRTELGSRGRKICFEAWAGLAELARRTGESAEVIRMGEALALAAEGRAPIRELARVHYLLGCLLFPRGELEGCARHHEAALAAAESCGSYELQARARGGLGDVEFMRGRMKTCNVHCRAAISLARAHEMPEVEASTLALAASNRLYDGDLAGVKRAIHRGLPLVEALGDLRAKCLLLCIGTWRYIQIGRIDRALTYAEGMAKIVDTLGMAHLRGICALNSAELALLDGRRAEAEAIAAGALEVAVAGGQTFINASLMGMCALASTQPGRRAEWIARGRKQLERTAFAHDHLHFYRFAFDAALEQEDWALVDEMTDVYTAFIAAEPAGWSVFVLERARFLAARGRAPERSSHALVGQALRERALAKGFRLALRGI